MTRLDPDFEAALDRLFDRLEPYVAVGPADCPLCGGPVELNLASRLRCRGCGSPLTRATLDVPWYAGRVPVPIAVAAVVLAAPVIGLKLLLEDRLRS